MIQRIGCMEIPVSNMEESVDFYENVLGLKKTYEYPVWTSFDIGGTSFALAASGTKGGEGRKDMQGLFTLCVQVLGQQDGTRQGDSYRNFRYLPCGRRS
jgi:catechol 2,3-dioxygenase-like lactoylglutathione lyase family enzyme